MIGKLEINMKHGDSVVSVKTDSAVYERTIKSAFLKKMTVNDLIHYTMNWKKK